jgi:soluble lytic murein transglycosylase-like protein
MRGKIFITMGALAALASVATTARAAESVTLVNGFAIQCRHHAEVEGRVRLYMGEGQDNYIEFAPQEITAVEQVPDPPAPPKSNEEAPTTGQSATLYPADLRQMLASAGQEHNLDVDLLASLVKAESGGNARAVSRAGARGLMQLMPSTAAGLGVKDSFRPEENVRGGTAYLDALLIRYHDNLSLALAAYNAGPQAVDKYKGIPPYRETKVYVARVIHEFNRRVVARQSLAAHAMASASAPHLDAPR